MSRIFDHKKQYACTEVFRLEDLQKTAQELEDADDEDYELLRDGWKTLAKELIRQMLNASQTINEFIANLQEQERRK